MTSFKVSDFSRSGNLVVRDNNYTLELLEDDRGEPEAKVGLVTSNLL